MGTLLLSVILLALLFVSTTKWAVSHVKEGAEKTTDDVMKARLWAAGMSFALLLVFTLASTTALLSAGETGLGRLLSAVVSPWVRAALVACGAVSFYPAYLCARIWNSGSGRTSERVHLSLHVAMVYVIVVALLFVRAPVG